MTMLDPSVQPLVMVAGVPGPGVHLSLAGRRRGGLMEQADTVSSLVERARDGDQSAWDCLVERYLPLVCGTIARTGLYGAQAEDVNQTVWLRLVEHLDEIREPLALPGWIATTARRECIRALQKQSRLVPVDPRPVLPSSSAARASPGSTMRSSPTSVARRCATAWPSYPRTVVRCCSCSSKTLRCPTARSAPGWGSRLAASVRPGSGRWRSCATAWRCAP